MKRFWVVLLLLALAATSFCEAFDILRFSVDINLKKDGSMDVTERISVRFNEARRGIFRDIPIDYPTGKGVVRRVAITGIRVTDGAGQPLKKKTSRKGPNIDIRIGDPEVYLSPGTEMTYVIQYSALGMINRFEAQDGWDSWAELYWNATGNEWPVGMQTVDITVHFPEDPSGGKALRARAFAGTYGDRDGNLQVGLGKNTDTFTQTELNLTNGTLSCTRLAPLNPYEGVTIVLSLPSKLIDPLSPWQQFVLFVLPNLGFGLPIIPLLVMPILWLRFGRDPKAGPMVVQFVPPSGMCGSSAGAFIDERVDQRDISAIFVSLAVKGYLTINDPLNGDPDVPMRLTSKPVNTNELSPAEAKVIELLGTGDLNITTENLRSRIGPQIYTIHGLIYQDLVSRNLYRKSPSTVKTAYSVGGIAVMLVLGFITAVASPFGEVAPVIVGGILSAVIILLFAKIMPARTVQGAKELSRVRGFYEFISRAKERELKFMEKVDKSQMLFEEYLPHAVAFGLTSAWTEAFQDIELQTPNWYRSNSPGFNPYLFNSSMNTFTEKAAVAASTPPRSSGASGGSSGFGGGGGFSGGGFGGGGGGSW